MLSLRLSARRLARGTFISFLVFSELRFIALTSALSCLFFGLLCLWRPPAVVFGFSFFAFPFARPVFFAFLLLASGLFLVFFHGVAAARERFCRDLADGQKAPAPVFSFTAGVRRLQVAAAVYLRLVPALAALLLPAALVLAAAFLKRENEKLFSLGLLFAAVLALAGAPVFFCYKGRYFGALAACALDPTLSPALILKEAKRQNDGRLIEIFVFSLGFLPWRVFSLSLFSLPFVTAFSGIARALFLKKRLSG